MKILLCVLMLLVAAPSSGQVPVPNTFSPDGIIYSSEVNANFTALASDALNRTGGTITGNIVVSAGITIDGVDIGAFLNQAVLTTSSPTFVGLTLSGALTNTSTGSFSGLTVTGTGASSLDVGGGLNIGTGNVALVGTDGRIPAITSTYFASTSPVLAVAAKTTTYAATTADAVLTADGTFTITLYAAAGNAGRILEIKNIGTGVITIDGNGAELIDGAATQTLDGQYFSYTLVCDGTGWSIL